MHVSEALEQNKHIVLRFNREVIEGSNEQVFWDLISPDFINRTATPSAPSGPEGMISTFRLLRSAFPNLRVRIHDQLAEGDKVVTRKTIAGVHQGEFMGIPPSGREIHIEVIDIVRILNGRYIEHWGINTLPAVLAELSAADSSPR